MSRSPPPIRYAAVVARGTLPLDFGGSPGAPPAGEPPALGVAELVRRLARAVAEPFAEPPWVEGEVGTLRPSGAGHVYFTLKDERVDASLDAVAFGGSLTARGRALLAEGARVRVRGRPDVWPARGKLQLVVDRVLPAGRGALLEALERLKARLAGEGLFDEGRKRPLPSEPRRVGVVTSASGAAIHDIRVVAAQRGGARILLSPATVQGNGAAQSIVTALARLARVPDVDVIIVGRGGGSTEDLAAWNDEALVRAVAACPVPVVSAVGHQTDFTLVDFVADRRAATPSQAAELVVPDRRARLDALSRQTRALHGAARHRLAEAREAHRTLLRRLGDPRSAVADERRRLGMLDAALWRAIRTRLGRSSAELHAFERRLVRLQPGVVLERRTAEARAMEVRVIAAARARLAGARGALAEACARLDAMSPLAVLARGYAIATTGEGRAIRAAGEVSVGDRIGVRVHAGSLDCQVIATHPEGEPR
jgi:exodeoxyribonuclease VII large subunit